jgi:hypothetical protein
MNSRVVTIAAGEDLIESLTKPEAGWAQASGHVEGVELKAAGESTDPTRALRGRWTLVSLVGPTSGPFTATLSRATDTGLELVGGTLVRARSAGVNAWLVTAGAPAIATPIASTSQNPSTMTASSYASPPPRAAEPARVVEVAPSTPADRRTVSSTDRAATPPAAPTPAPATSQPEAARPVGWNAVATASELAAEQAEADEDAKSPHRGDLIDHFAFGLCEVVTEEGDRLKLRDIRGPGRIREIVPEMLIIKGPTVHESGKRLFRLLQRS